MALIERRESIDRRVTDSTECGDQCTGIRVEPCALHEDMPALIGKLVASGQWLIRITKFYMICLGTVVCAAFAAIIAINIQYNTDMKSRDTIRNAISERVHEQKARLDKIDYQVWLNTEKDREIMDLLKQHVEDWRKDKGR